MAIQPSFREIWVVAALFRSRRSARRPTLGLGSLSVLDAVRCCTARGSKLKLDVIVRLGKSRVAMRRRAFDPGCLELRLPACIRVRGTQDRVGSEDFDGSRDRWEPSALTAVISDGSSRDGQEARSGHVAPCQPGIWHVGGGVLRGDVARPHAVRWARGCEVRRGTMPLACHGGPGPVGAPAVRNHFEGGGFGCASSLAVSLSFQFRSVLPFVVH